MNIPRDKDYPVGAGQCGVCGGHGCSTCGNKGWLPYGDPKIRKCEHPQCQNPILPNQVAVYCTNMCAASDAQ